MLSKRTSRNSLLSFLLRLLFGFLLVCSTACGYKLQESFEEGSLPTISIPYVIDDLDGEITSVIIKEIAASGAYEYRSSGGQFTLLVKIVDLHDENIGFRYDRTRKGSLTHSIIPVETRHYILAEVSLVEAANCQTVLKSTLIQAEIDFDHDYYTIRHRANTFSLGQLTDIDSAEDASMRPLYKNLAEKIVDFVIYGW